MCPSEQGGHSLLSPCWKSDKLTPGSHPCKAQAARCGRYPHWSVAVFPRQDSSCCRSKRNRLRATFSHSVLACPRQQSRAMPKVKISSLFYPFKFSGAKLRRFIYKGFTINADRTYIFSESSAIRVQYVIKMYGILSCMGSQWGCFKQIHSLFSAISM